VLDHQPQQVAELQKARQETSDRRIYGITGQRFSWPPVRTLIRRNLPFCPGPRPAKRLVEALNPLLGQPACQIGICISMISRVASSIYSMLTNEEV
jgi:hypothetical protein